MQAAHLFSKDIICKLHELVIVTHYIPSELLDQKLNIAKCSKNYELIERIYAKTQNQRLLKFFFALLFEKNSIYTSILVVLKTQKTMRLPPNNSTILLFVSEFRSLRKVWNEIYWLRTLGVLPIGWRRTPWGASRRVHFIPTDLARVRDIQLASFQGQHHVHPPQYQTTHSEPKIKKNSCLLLGEKKNKYGLKINCI